ncbi:MAG: 3-hydroxyacyl-CoA dehydrogenase NAD-binding domain-containing protein [Actinomycetota bacterium]
MMNGSSGTKPITFGPRGLLNFAAALDTVTARIATDHIIAVALIGQPGSFAAGADLHHARQLTKRRDALTMAHYGQQQFRRLAELPVPSFAYLNGPAVGGGLELALHATYRTISRNVHTVGLPEVGLGVIPGWGGCTLLPRLIGPTNALTVIVTNPLQRHRMLAAAQAKERGIVDHVVDPATFLIDSLRWTMQVLHGEITPERFDHCSNQHVWDDAVRETRATITSTVGEVPAPHRALDIVAATRTADLSTSLANEGQAVADLVMSDQFRASAYAFDLTRRRNLTPRADSFHHVRSLRQVAVIGGGVMGSQLAVLFAWHLGLPVCYIERDDQQLAHAGTRIQREIAQLRRRHRISDITAARLSSTIRGSTELSQLAHTDLVIEAVTEDFGTKRALFGALEAVVPEQCVIATNTSSLSVTRLAQGLAHPERIIGMHFFNPVTVLPLVEIISGTTTHARTRILAVGAASAVHGVPLTVQDGPSFVVNRLLGRYLNTVGQLIDTGIPIPLVDNALRDIAPLAPYRIIQLVGPQVAAQNERSLATAYPNRFTPSVFLNAVVGSGQNMLYAASATPGADTLLPGVARLLPSQHNLAHRDQVREQVLIAVADEARRILDERIVESAEDIDLALMLGAGFRWWNGGICPLLDRTGIATHVTGQHFLPRGVASTGTSRGTFGINRTAVHIE